MFKLFHIVCFFGWQCYVQGVCGCVCSSLPPSLVISLLPCSQVPQVLKQEVREKVFYCTAEEVPIEGQRNV